MCIDDNVYTHDLISDYAGMKRTWEWGFIGNVHFYLYRSENELFKVSFTDSIWY